MMKFTILLSFLLSFNLFASSVDQAESLYALRGESAENAKAAADVYGQLAVEAEGDTFLQGMMFSRQSESIYYYAESQKSKKLKKQYFNEGVEYGDAAIAVYEAALEAGTISLDDEQVVVDYAYAMYIRSANLGKWAKAKGVRQSLKRRKEIFKYTRQIIGMGEVAKAINSYGANRVLARVLYKLPGWADGDKKEALSLQEEAYNKTLDEAGVCTHGLNVIYYAESLIKADREADAVMILKKFVAADGKTLNPSRVPETLAEQAEARELLEDLE